MNDQKPPKVMQQVPFRMHVNDHIMLKKLLRDDDLSFQRFTEACVMAFLRGDPHMLKVIKTHKELHDVPEDDKRFAVLSYRERMALLDELEKSEAKEHATDPV